MGGEVFADGGALTVTEGVFGDERLIGGRNTSHEIVGADDTVGF
jgi:hypothetical protein